MTQTKHEPLTQWKKRVLLFQYIYSQLLKENSAQEAKAIFINKFQNIDVQFIQVYEYFLDHKQAIIAAFKPHLQASWSFERLNYVDQAILFAAYSEYKTLNVDKAIIIDQALISFKKYSDQTNYAYINALLDKVL